MMSATSRPRQRPARLVLNRRFVILGGLSLAHSGVADAAPATEPAPEPVDQPQPHIITAAGRRFAALGGPQRVRRRGDWFDLESRPGDRRSSDGRRPIRRIGLDGWPAPFPTDDSTVRTRFSLILGEGTMAQRPGNWLMPFELHALPLAGDVHRQAGPLGISVEWSEGRRASRLRVWRREWNGNSTIEADLPVEGHRRYDFFVEHRVHDTLGRLFVEMDGRAIVNYTGAFGYGQARALYPQFRLYSDDREGVMRARIRPISFDIRQN